MTKPRAGSGELFIHLDVAGLAALMKAVETAMTDGRGHLILPDDSGTVVRKIGSDRPFGAVTVTFAGAAGPPDEAWRTGRPDPEPEPRRPALEFQD